ncbi:hypothetical protein SK128_005028 [Halocaridina rubra]|uniref:Uncharacterized protein n=1 Tax=Halocaridina rubra TaxID=373956 RepID=A0AAN9A735_HALRR
MKSARRERTRFHHKPRYLIHFSWLVVNACSLCRPTPFYQEVYSLLQNTSAWMMYPCGETTISSFFPSESEIPYLPEHWANLQHIKEQVRRLENYQCANGSFLIEEIKFDDRLSSSVTNLVENMVPGPVNVSSSLQLMKSFLELLMQSDPQALLNDLGLGGREDTLFQELEKSFADITLTPQRFIRMLADIADMMMLFLDSDDGTKTLSDNIMFFMYHARAVITNVTAMLDGNYSDMLYNSSIYSEYLYVQNNYDLYIGNTFWNYCSETGRVFYSGGDGPMFKPKTGDRKDAYP